MKTVFNIVLVLCAAALIYICYSSIMVLSILKKRKGKRAGCHCPFDRHP